MFTPTTQVIHQAIMRPWKRYFTPRVIEFSIAWGGAGRTGLEMMWSCVTLFPRALRKIQDPKGSMGTITSLATHKIAFQKHPNFAFLFGF